MQPTSDPKPVLVDTTLGPIAVTREGPISQAPAVLCLHGIPGSVRDFRYLAPQLTERALHVIRIDAPGMGATPYDRKGPPQLRTVPGWAELYHAVAEALHLDRYAVLGHSFGGAAAMHAAAQRGARDRVAGLILVSAPGPRRHRAYFVPPWGFAALGWLAALPVVRLPMSEFGRLAFRGLGLQAPAHGDWRRLEHLVLVTSSLRFDDLAAKARALSCPTLLCHCADDPLVEVEIARQSAALIRRCETLIFTDGGHYPQKHHAVAIAEAVARMLDAS